MHAMCVNLWITQVRRLCECHLHACDMGVPVDLPGKRHCECHL